MAAILALGVLAIVLAIWAASTVDRISSDEVDLRDPALDAAASPVQDHMVWALAALNGVPVTEEALEARMSPGFIDAVPVSILVEQVAALVDLGPFRPYGLQEDEDLTGGLLLASDETWALFVAANPDRPDLLEGLQLLPVTPDKGPFSNGEVAAHLAGGLALLLAGVVAGWHRWRSGGILLISGVLWLGQLLELSSSSVLYTAGLLAGPIALAAVGHGLLRSPGGQLETQADRALTAAAYAGGLLGVAHLLFLDFEVWSFPAQRLTVTHDGQTADHVRLVATVVAMIVAVAIAGRGWFRAAGQRGSARREAAIRAFVRTGVAAPLLVIGVMQFGGDQFDLSQSAALSAAVVLVPIGLAAEASQRQAALGDVAAMVADLGSAPQDLRDSLAVVLDDPTLELVFYSVEHDGYVALDGLPVSLPSGPDRAVTRLSADAEPIGAVVHRPELLEEPERVRAACAAVRLAIHNQQLQAVVAAQLREVRASRARILAAAEEGRRQIERDLHDGAQQRLLGLQLLAKMEAARVAGDDPDLDAWFQRLSDELAGTLGELRELGRGLHPSSLDRGLVAALHSLAERSPIPVVLHAPESLDDLRSDVALAAYLVCSEALTNAARHSKADHVTVVVERTADVLRCQVIDTGVGGAVANPRGGLRNIADRVEVFGGTLNLQTPAAGSGTVVTVEIPT